MKTENDNRGREKNGMSRRHFFTTMGVGAVTLAVGNTAVPAERGAGASANPDGTVNIVLRINGDRYSLLAEPRWTLLYVLRERLGLTGAKEGCGRGECGACTVLIDGVPRYASMTLAVEAEDADITTAEGLLEGEALGPVQQAFLETDAFQCGYCTSGQVMTVEGLLRAEPNPSMTQIRKSVSGNICRCGAYSNIFKAAVRAGELKRKA